MSCIDEPSEEIIEYDCLCGGVGIEILMPDGDWKVICTACEKVIELE